MPVARDWGTLVLELTLGVLVAIGGGVWLWGVLDVLARDHTEFEDWRFWLVICCVGGPFGTFTWAVFRRPHAGDLPSLEELRTPQPASTGAPAPEQTVLQPVLQQEPVPSNEPITRPYYMENSDENPQEQTEIGVTPQVSLPSKIS